MTDEVVRHLEEDRVPVEADGEPLKGADGQGGGADSEFSVELTEADVGCRLVSLDRHDRDRRAVPAPDLEPLPRRPQAPRRVTFGDDRRERAGARRTRGAAGQDAADVAAVAAALARPVGAPLGATRCHAGDARSRARRSGVDEANARK
jgi:hypothetical protein